VETLGGTPKPVITIQAGGVYDVYFQPQGNYLIYNKDAGGNETFQFFLYDIATRESKPITEAKSRSTEPVWPNSGDRIIYSSSPPSGNGVDLSLINPFEPQSNRGVHHERRWNFPAPFARYWNQKREDDACAANGHYLRSYSDSQLSETILDEKAQELWAK
jgi:hypothetical protein